MVEPDAAAVVTGGQVLKGRLHEAQIRGSAAVGDPFGPTLRFAVAESGEKRRPE